MADREILLFNSYILIKKKILLHLASLKLMILHTFLRVRIV